MCVEQHTKSPKNPPGAFS